MNRHKVLKPNQIGLPEKYGDWRPTQEEAINVTITRNTRVMGLHAPTGSGKTGIALYLGYLASKINKPLAIVTQSRGLQDQLLREGKKLGVVDIRGRDNYTCGFREDYTCQDGFNVRCPYKGSVACPATQAEIRAAASNIVVTNYAKWTASRKFGQGLGHIQRVIFDEGHFSPEAVAKAMQTILHFREVQDDLGIDFPAQNDCHKMTVWKSWALTARNRAEVCLREAKERIDCSSPKVSWVKHYGHVKNLLRRLSVLALCNPLNWEVDEFKDSKTQTLAGYQFDPIHPGKYGEATLLLHVDNIVFMSATLRPKTLHMVGIPTTDITFREFESSFNPADCPIYYVPTLKVDRRNPDLSMLWMRMDQTIAPRQRVKGLIHTVSYTRRDEILNLSRFSSQMIVNPKGEPPTQMVEMFLDGKPGSILVSPAIGIGYDFPGKAAEYQIVCKIPFEPPSKIQKARELNDKEYSYFRAAQTMEQQFGRINRFEGDRGQSFIFDMNLEWFLPRYGHLFSKDFFRRLKRVGVLPPPLPPM